MSKYKKDFELDVLTGDCGAKALIIGENTEDTIAYFKIEVDRKADFNFSACIKDKDLERFAVNILRALNSNKLKGG